VAVEREKKQKTIVIFRSSLYGINRPNFVERLGNCEMEEEHGHRHSSISFGFWNSPDFILHSNSGVSVVVVYPAIRMLAALVQQECFIVTK
jgi:hypothetical protein